MADGTKIDGLTRYADGRWKVSPFAGQPKPIEFREPDERLGCGSFSRPAKRQPQAAKVAVSTCGNGMMAGLAKMVERPKVSTVRNDDGTVTVVAAEVLDRPAYWA